MSAVSMAKWKIAGRIVALQERLAEIEARPSGHDNYFEAKGFRDYIAGLQEALNILEQESE